MCVSASTATPLHCPLHAPTDKMQLNKDDSNVCLGFHFRVDQTLPPAPFVSKLLSAERDKGQV